jgi:hypothetical protein
MSDFNYQAYLKNNPLLQEEVKEEKLLTESQEITEGIPQESEIADYVEAMFNDSVVEKEGFQSDIWTKEEYAATSRGEGSVFMDLAKHLNSVGGKDVLEGNPDIHLELLSNGDIQWSADVTLDENLAEEEIQEEVPSSKMKVSELKAKIKEDIISLLNEEEEDEEDVEVEDDIEMDMDVEEPSMDAAPEVGLSKDEQEIQDSLKLAYDNAVAIGDEKLADQIGNSITFFTRTHVVER